MKFVREVHRRRPSIEDPEVLEGLCDRIISGEPFWRIFSDKDMPSSVAVYKEMAKGSDIGRKIARAREIGTDAEIDFTLQLADRANVENYKVRELQIKSRQWRSSKINSSRYGDLAKLRISDDDPGTIKVVIVNDPDVAKNSVA